MSYETQLQNDWTVAVESFETRQRIMREALKKVDFRASSGAVREAHPPTAGKYAPYVGVDKPNRVKDTYRARISLWDCSAGQWIRINQTGFTTPAEAGFWYICAHIAFWGSLSVHAREVSVEVYEALRKR